MKSAAKPVIFAVVVLFATLAVFGSAGASAAEPPQETVAEPVLTFREGAYIDEYL